MASLKVEVTSRQMIKPSSPTPKHLNNLQFSFLDQFAPPVYIPLIFFYTNEPSHPLDHIQLSILLKRSLSNTLVNYYPLAGRLEGNTSILCNDEGVEYNEAYVSTTLMEVLENPNLGDLKNLLPFEPITNTKIIVLGVQVNHFSCGGMAISVCISHKVADGTAMVAFVSAWARETLVCHQRVDTNDNVVLNPKFDSATLFPPRDLNGVYIPRSSICKEKIATRRFIFDKKKLDALKEQIVVNNDKSLSQVMEPTRVEVVTALFWKQMMKVSKAKAKLTKISIVVHAVNLRNRVTSPIPSDSFGNFWWFAIAPLLVEEEEKEYSKLVGKIKGSIRKIDNDFVKKLQNGEGLLEIKKVIEGDDSLTKEYVELCNFSSWCRFPLYEVDFGWGKPSWVCSTTLPFKNVVILLSTKCGEGIEAWVNMLEDDMALLELDHELCL